MTDKSSIAVKKDEAPGIGHNKPPEPIPGFAYTDNKFYKRGVTLLVSLRKVANDFPEIDSKELADKYQDAIDQVLDFKKQVEDARVAKRKPLNAALKQIQEEYVPIHTMLDNGLGVMTARRNKYLRAEQDRIREEQRQADERARKAKEEAEAKARAAAEQMEAADRGELAGTDADPLAARADAQAAQEAAKQAEKDARQAQKQKATVGGGGYATSTGRATRAHGLRKHYSARVTNHKKALKHFRDHPKVRDLVQTLADELARTPATRENLPEGIELVMEER